MENCCTTDNGKFDPTTVLAMIPDLRKNSAQRTVWLYEF